MIVVDVRLCFEFVNDREKEGNALYCIKKGNGGGEYIGRDYCRYSPLL